MIEQLIYTLVLGDVLFTIWSISLLRKYKPKLKNWYEAEANGMVVFLWKRYGLVRGTLISLIIQGIVLSLFINLFTRDMMFFAFGMYFMLFYFHLANILYYKNKLKLKKRRKHGHS